MRLKAARERTIQAASEPESAKPPASASRSVIEHVPPLVDLIALGIRPWMHERGREPKVKLEFAEDAAGRAGDPQPP